MGYDDLGIDVGVTKIGPAPTANDGSGRECLVVVHCENR